MNSRFLLECVSICLSIYLSAMPWHLSIYHN